MTGMVTAFLISWISRGSDVLIGLDALVFELFISALLA